MMCGISKPVRVGLIYKITNKVNGKAYVGQTVLPTARARYAGHVKDALKGSPLAIHRAIRKYGAGNFTVRTLKRVTEATLDAAEICFIAKHKTHGHGGYNATKGGDGAVGLKWRRASRLRMSSACIRKFKDPLKRAEVSAAVTALWQTDDYRDTMEEAQRQRWLRAEEHVKSSTAHKSQVNKPGIRKSISETAMALWQDDAYRAAMAVAQVRGVVRRAASITKLWQTDSHRAKMAKTQKRRAAKTAVAVKILWQTDEYRSKMVAAQKRRRAREREVKLATSK